MKRRGRRAKDKPTEDFSSREGVLAFVDELMPDKKGSMRAYARTKSQGATGGALKSLDDRIRKISAQKVAPQQSIPESKLRSIDETAQAVKQLGSAVSALETRVADVTAQSNKTLGMLGELLDQFNNYKKATDAKFVKLEKESKGGAASGGMLGSMFDLMSLAGDAKSGAKPAAVATSKAPAATASVAKSGLMKSMGSLAKGVGGRLPMVGGLIDGVAEFVQGGDLGKSIAAGAGNILGGILGGALGTVLAPGVGTAVGAVGGSMMGAELARSGYDWIFGKKAPKESANIKAAREQQEKPENKAPGATPQTQPAGAPPPGTMTPPPAQTNTGGAGGGATTTPPSGGGGGGSAVMPPGGADVDTNKQLFIKAMNDAGVKNNEERAAMAAVITGESGFRLQSETSYSKTDNARIRQIFGSTVERLNDAQLNELKKNDEAFFNRVYGGRLGNAPNEGFKYRGRGFIQLTGKGNYEKYSRITGVDLVSNPDLANDPATAAKIAAIYMMKTRAGGNAYESIARGVGNPVASTEAVKKTAYSQYVKSGEFSSDKAGAEPAKSGEEQKAGGETGGTPAAGGAGSGATAVQQDNSGAAPPTSGGGYDYGSKSTAAAASAPPASGATPSAGTTPDATPVQKDSAGGGYQKGKGRDFSDKAQGLTFAPGVDPRINDGIAQKIASIESSFGKLTVSSGYRDPQRNAAAGGAKNSAHMRQNAVDVTFAGDQQKTLQLVEIASKAGIGGIGVYKPGHVHLDTESKRVWGPSYGPDSIPQWARAALSAHMSGQWGQYDPSAAGKGPAGQGDRETAGSGGGRPEGGVSRAQGAGGGIPAGVVTPGITRTQAVPISGPDLTSRAQFPGGGGIAGTIARAPGMGPLAGILGGMNLGKMPSLGGGILGSISSTILGQATSMIGSQISGAIMGPGGIGGTPIGGKLLGGLLGPGTGSMIGPIVSAAGRGDARTLAGPQPLNTLMSMIGGLMNNFSKAGQTQQRNPNMQFTPDNYQDSNVPRAMPPQGMMREMFGYDIASGYYPQR